MDHPRQQQAVDLLVAYDWPYDRPFVALLEEVIRSAKRGLWVASPTTLRASLEELQAGVTTVRAYLDLTTGDDPAFQALDAWAEVNVPFHFNPAARRRRAWRKSNLHWAFIEAGVHTPHTIFVPAYKRQPELEPPHDFEALGVPFSIKPDLGGGGWEVVTDARDWHDVLEARWRLAEEDLILQSFVKPAQLEGRRGWFRTLYASGKVFPCWWDDQTRLFGPPVTSAERERLNLEPLWHIAHIAAEISGLNLFSTEIARPDDGRFIVVDYVNDPVDLRFVPHAKEGMPAEVARGIAEAITEALPTPG